MFTRRIIAFNETFAVLGGAKNSKKVHLLALWTEATQGRKCENICSAFWQFLKFQRDADEIIIWMDNCSAQNKNWTLFSSMLTAMNQNGPCSAKKITFKYLPAGHTFMSADSVHHGLEVEMKKAKNIYDWDDFLAMAKRSNSGRVSIVDMQVTDFYKWKDEMSKFKQNRAKILLRDMVSVEFRRNDRKLYYKTSFDEEFVSAELLKDKAQLTQPATETIPRGISKERKNEILQKLGPLMPENRRPFWENLNESDETQLDLAYSYDT